MFVEAEERLKIGGCVRLKGLLIIPALGTASSGAGDEGGPSERVIPHAVCNAR
jgi:hypothetical protein